MSFRLEDMAEHVATREMLAVEKWMTDLGVTMATVHDYSLTIRHDSANGTEYQLFRRYPSNHLVGRLRVTYTATDVAISVN